MSAEAALAIAELDQALADVGQDIELHRLVGTQLIPIKVRCRAIVRRYRADELVGGITQNDDRVILSPTEIIRAGWPGPNSSATPTERDRRVPRKGDKAVIAGVPRNIEVAMPVYVDNELVRIELQVLG